MRILIVDDHALVRDGVRAMLTNHPLADVVGEASDAEQAMQQVALLAPELVVTDIGMKHCDGLALAQRLRDAHPAVAVLILSMYDNAEYVRRAERVGARGYVLKDAPSAELLAAVDAIAAGNTYFSVQQPGPRSPDGVPHAELSDRECEILRGLARGLSSKQLASELDLSVRTVETHRQNIRRKLRIAGQAELIRYACEHHKPVGG